MRRTELDLMVAGVIGAAGVADAALSAHVTAGGPLAQAAEIMMVHAAAIVGLVAYRRGVAGAPTAVGKIALTMGLAAALFRRRRDALLLLRRPSLPDGGADRRIDPDPRLARPRRAGGGRAGASRRAADLIGARAFPPPKDRLQCNMGSRRVLPASIH
jgi:hypothetical protein